MKLSWISLLFVVVASAAQSGGATALPGPGKSSAADNQLCISCHQDVGDKLMTHAHAGVACQSCHVKHEEYPHPEGIAKPACASCHSGIAKDYSHSAHAQAASRGNGAAPDCATCHGKAHELDAAKTVQFRTAVPELCGSCHSDVTEQYQDSVHGQAIKKGLVQAPVCTDCHGEHSILPPQNAASSVNPNHVRDTCGGCHNDVRLTRRFGLPADRVISFDASYHGLASKSGAQTVANCASCHGVHNIRSSSDPKSTIHPANLARTCGQCHVGAGQRFALGPIHTARGYSEATAVKWVRWFYLLVIPLTIGFMFLHNLGDWLHKLIRLRFVRAGWKLPEQPTGVEVLRTLPFERLQHAALALSFMVLVWTGFALKYPDQWWARPMLLLEGPHSMRGLVHRIASVIFMSAALAHIFSLILSRRLRSHWRSLWPRAADLHEAGANFAYNLGLRRAKPVRSSHSYVEKAEYWALVWGSVVMIGTGLLLWGNDLALQWMPKVVLDLATSVHFYEAVLATLAILVWHFYFVLFDPDVYPMDTAWLTGKSPRKEPADEAHS